MSEEPSKEWRDHVTDLVGDQLEGLAALFLKLHPGVRNRFGVGHGLEVDGEKYRYEFVLVREGTYEYGEMKRKHQNQKGWKTSDRAMASLDRSTTFQ